MSDASVLRFVREMGYEGFNALKDDLHSIISERVLERTAWTSLSSRLDSSAVLPAQENLPDEFLQMMCGSIEKAFAQNDMAVFDRIVTQLNEADHTYIVGFRGCSGVAHFFARTLRYVIDRVVEVSSADVDAIGMLQSISDKDMMILLSYARYYKMDMEICKIAQDRNVKIYLLTDDLTSPVASYADHTIVVDTNSKSFYNSMTALHFVCEYIITLLCREKEQVLRERLNANDGYSNFLRI